MAVTVTPRARRRFDRGDVAEGIHRLGDHDVNSYVVEEAGSRHLVRAVPPNPRETVPADRSKPASASPSLLSAAVPRPTTRQHRDHRP